MKKIMLTLTAVLSFNTIAACPVDCLSKQQLIDMTPQQIVNEMVRLSKQPNILLNDASSDWINQINGWERAYTPDKVAAVTKLLQQSYTSGGNADLVNSTLPAKYLSSMNYTYHVYVKNDKSRDYSQFSADHATMINNVASTAAAIMNNEAVIIESYNQVETSYVAMYELLRLAESPETRPEVNVEPMLAAAMNYTAAAMKEPFTNSDGNFRLVQLRVPANMISLHAKSPAWNRLNTRPNYHEVVNTMGVVANQMIESLQSQFFTPREAFINATPLIKAVSWSMFKSDYQMYNKYLSAIKPMSSAHLYLASLIHTQQPNNCQSVTQINLCKDQLVAKMNEKYSQSYTRDDVTIVGNMPDIYAQHLHDQLHTVKAAYSEVFGPLQPVANDTNARVKIIVYNNQLEYEAYQTLINNLPSNNGGIYIEQNGTMYTYVHDEDMYNSKYFFHTEELVRHEYVHYLNGRYLIPGNFNESTLYTNNGLVSIEEGLANYFAGASNHHAPTPVGTMVLWFAQNPSAYNLQQDLNKSYVDNGVYEHSAMAIGYMASQGKLGELKDILRSENVTGLQAWKTGHSGMYQNYVSNLVNTPTKAQWDTPFIKNGLHLNSAVELDKLADIQGGFVSKGMTNVQCALLNDIRYNCTGQYSGMFKDKLRELADVFLNFKYTSCELTATNTWRCVGVIRKAGTEVNQKLFNVTYTAPTEVQQTENLKVTISLNVQAHYDNKFSLVNVSVNSPDFKLTTVNSGNTVTVTSDQPWSGNNSSTVVVSYAVKDSTDSSVSPAVQNTIKLNAPKVQPPITSPSAPASEKSGGSMSIVWLLALGVLITRRGL